MFKSDSGKGREGQLAEDTKLFKAFKTKAGFEGVHENDMILKGLAVTDQMKVHVDTCKNRVQGGEGKQSELLKSLMESKKIQMFGLCFSFAS